LFIIGGLSCGILYLFLYRSLSSIPIVVDYEWTISCCGLIEGDLIRYPLRQFFLEDDLFVGSLGSERLEAGPRTLYWSLIIHLPSEDSQRSGCLREYFPEPCGISRFSYFRAEGRPCSLIRSRSMSKDSLLKFDHDPFAF